MFTNNQLPQLKTNSHQYFKQLVMSNFLLTLTFYIFTIQKISDVSLMQKSILYFLCYHQFFIFFIFLCKYEETVVQISQELYGLAQLGTPFFFFILLCSIKKLNMPSKFFSEQVVTNSKCLVLPTRELEKAYTVISHLVPVKS